LLQPPVGVSLPALRHRRLRRPGGAGEVGAFEIGAVEMRAGEIGEVEPRAGEVSVLEPRADEVGFVKPCADQMETSQVDSVPLLAA
jgi:hypothetical protein